MTKKVYGHGINDLAGTPGMCSVNGKITKPYHAWHGVLKRCYSSKCHKNQPTYQNCTCDPAWHLFSVFRTWYISQIINSNTKYSVDKDIKIPGNKIYSPSTCVLIPGKLNDMAVSAITKDSGLPTGVTHMTSGNLTKPYYVCVKNGMTNTRFRQCYSTLQEATSVYVSVKTRYFLGAAQYYFDNGEITYNTWLCCQNYRPL